MSFDIEITMREQADGTLVASVEADDVTEDGVPMALTRAVAGLCTTVGMPTPEQLFRGLSIVHDDQPRELAAINDALGQRGFGGHTGAQGVAEVLDHLIGQSFATVAGPDFEHALGEARSAYRVAALAAQDIEAHHLAGEKAIPSPSQVAAMMRATSTLGALLHPLRGIAAMPPSVPIAVAEGDVEVTGGRGEPC